MASSDHEVGKIAPSTPRALLENKDVHVTEVKGLGRGLVWLPSNGRTLLEGSTVLRLEPEMIVLYKEALKTHCHTCFRSDQQYFLRCCFDCKLIRYCSLSCQEADKPLHQQECKSMKKAAVWHKDAKEPDYKDLPSGIIRMGARLIWQRSRQGDDWWKKVEDLCYHKHEVKKDDDPYKAQILSKYLHAGLETQVVGGTDQPSQANPPQELHEYSDLLARVNDNVYGISKQSGQPLAYALSTVAALLNHSCDPNCSIKYPKGLSVNDCIHVVARKDIKAGEQMTISYVEGNDPLPVQQDKDKVGRLMSFLCKCAVCEAAKKNNKEGDLVMEQPQPVQPALSMVSTSTGAS